MTRLQLSAGLVISVNQLSRNLSHLKDFCFFINHKIHMYYVYSLIKNANFPDRCADNLAPNFSLYEFFKTKYLCTKTRQNATPISEVVGSMFPNTRKNVGVNLESTTMNQLLHQKRIYNPPLKDSIRLL